MSQVSVAGQRSARRYPPEVRRALIVEAAEQVFADRGYHGASVEHLAEAAGVARALIHRYFGGGTDAVFLACVETARAELETRFIEAVLAEMEPEQMLRAGVLAYFTFVRDRGARWEVLFGGGTAVSGPVAAQVADLRFATAEKIVELVKAAAPALPYQDAAAYAHVISGAVEQLAKWWRRNPHLTLEYVTDHAVEALVRGLGVHIPTD